MIEKNNSLQEKSFLDYILEILGRCAVEIEL